MGQALRRARGAAARFAEEKSAPSDAARKAVAAEDEDRPIRLYSAGVRRVKTKEQLETEARWAAKSKELYGNPKPAPDAKARLRAQQEKETDYRPDPPFDKSYDQPFPGHKPVERESFDREWDQSDRTYKYMVQKAAGQVVSRTENVGPGGEVPRASSPQPFGTPAPLSRSKVDTADREGRIVPGKLNILQLKQAFLLHHGQAEGAVKQLSVEAIAEKFEVNPDLLKRVFKHTSLAEGKPVDKSIYRGVAKSSR
ncbi:uncharacterized protein LOC112346141 [Selaginella moellendorffii]|uniref:uncharacterized protein LOC112346141 n=1 Tax=Selaginella moellendorffii TaxID=88036 RepID=UPI000D1C727E|nr:uncharacterized protein LOC112346141 [Selaginella moellendorffii]|eukprot:XP_024530139.1 uncharacterized protein LOC112346141 [Selaginella moellendorffii]